MFSLGFFFFKFNSEIKKPIKIVYTVLLMLIRKTKWVKEHGIFMKMENFTYTNVQVAPSRIIVKHLKLMFLIRHFIGIYQE